jgi:hypothetical protein
MTNFNKLLILLFFCFSFSSCSENSNNEQSLPSSKVTENIDASTSRNILVTKRDIDVLQDSYLFFIDSDNRGFFLYPSNNMKIIFNHFFIKLLAWDVVRCGVIENKDTKAVINATLTKNFSGDISAIQNICSGENSILQISYNGVVKTVNVKEIKENPRFKQKRFIFPLIPYYYPSIKDIISSDISLPKIALSISFYNRFSKRTVTSCNKRTYKDTGDVVDTVCYKAPIIFPTQAFHGKSWKKQNMYTIPSILEYGNIKPK